MNGGCTLKDLREMIADLPDDMRVILTIDNRTLAPTVGMEAMLAEIHRPSDNYPLRLCGIVDHEEPLLRKDF